jgi:hypothetical protein
MALGRSRALRRSAASSVGGDIPGFTPSGASSEAACAARRRGITVVRYNKDQGANVVIPSAASGVN